MPLIKFNQTAVAKDLRDPEFAAEHLERCLKNSVRTFLIALRTVADANGGLGQLSIEASLGRESLYKSLPNDGESSPYFSTVNQILDSLGFEIAINPKECGKRAA